MGMTANQIQEDKIKNKTTADNASGQGMQMLNPATNVSKDFSKVNNQTATNNQSVQNTQNTAETAMQAPSAKQNTADLYTFPKREYVTPTVSNTALQISGINRIDTEKYETQLKQLNDAAIEQSNKRIDYAVDENERALRRALDDAQPQFRTQQNQIDIDERRALDNQALYAEARGDRGGVGQAQYNSIQNTAAINRLSVQQAQTKLATDTNRQIADLRAKGEFQKADNLLTLTQNYLSQLMSIEQWADQMNLSVDETNMALQQWRAEYEQNAAQYLDTWNQNNANMAYSDAVWENETAYNRSQTELERNRISGMQKIQEGIVDLTDEELFANGWTKQQAMEMALFYKAQREAEMESTNLSLESQRKAIEENQRNAIAESAERILQSGSSKLSREQLNALGITQEVADSWAKLYRAQIEAEEAERELKIAAGYEDIAASKASRERALANDAYNRQQDALDRMKEAEDTAYNRQQTEKDNNYNTGMLKLQAGYYDSLTKAELSAMGFNSAEQAKSWKELYDASNEKAAGDTGTGSGETQAELSFDDRVDLLYENASKSKYPIEYIKQNYKNFGFSSIGNLADEEAFDDWASEREDNLQKADNSFSERAAINAENNYMRNVKTSKPEENVFNTVINGKIQIPGIGFKTWDEVAELVDSGKIEEIPHKTNSAIYYEYRLKK